MNVLASFTVLASVLSSYAAVGMLCQVQRNECIAEVDTDALNRTSLEVSCVCKRNVDVSARLAELEKIRCASVPNYAEDPPIYAAKFRLQNCDIAEKPFPVKLLRLLRRSELFTIVVTGARSLRLISDENEDEDVSPNVTATFKNSDISSLGAGWLRGAQAASVSLQNCSVGVVEAEFVGAHTNTAKVDIEFHATRIYTVKSYAFFLPPRGSLLFSGGSILQLESDAIAGGRSTSFQGVRVSNIASHALNVFGLDYFAMDGCIVANMEKDAVVERNTGFERYARHVARLDVMRNKFSAVDGKAFASLCREEMQFKHNIILNTTSTLQLKTSHCSVSRDWFDVVADTGFLCVGCQHLEGPFDEQICSIYLSGWCLCDRTSHPKLLKPEDVELFSNSSNDAICGVPMQTYVNSYCKDSALAKVYLESCSKYASKVVPLEKQSYQYSGFATVQTKPLNQFIYVLVSTIVIFALF